MQKRPWQIDIIANDDVTQYKSVKKSRAMGLSEIKQEDYNVLAKARCAIFNNVIMGVPYDRKED